MEVWWSGRMHRRLGRAQLSWVFQPKKNNKKSELFSPPLTVWPTYLRLAASAPCSSQEFKCVTSGECISAEFVCDTDEDCADGSDEQRACSMFTHSLSWTKLTIHLFLFVCLFAISIPIDCDDSPSDGRTCGPDQFTCHEGQCIPSKYKCDHMKDCVDSSDENNCSK